MRVNPVLVEIERVQMNEPAMRIWLYKIVAADFRRSARCRRKKEQVSGHNKRENP
jgi:hypothetical protein